MKTETAYWKPLPGKFGCHDWFHHHGMKMRLVSCERVEGRLIIEGSAAKLTITAQPFKSTKQRTWAVEWEVRQSFNEKNNRGRVL